METSVVSGWAEDDGAQIAAVRISLADGWKTYWRAPGDAGIPPLFSFAGSENIAATEILWPKPEVFESAGLRTVGYHHELVLPIRITPQDASAPIALSALISMGVCEEICVPVEVELKADLAAARDATRDPEIVSALAATPQKRPGLAHCSAEPIRDGMRVTAHIDLPPPSGAPLTPQALAFAAREAILSTSQNPPDGYVESEVALFELLDMPVWISESDTRRVGEGLISTAEIVPDAAAPFDINLAALRFTVLSGGEAYEITGCEAL
jgi:hypothetical protein